MTEETVVYLARRALTTILLVGGPLLGLGLVTGLVVSLFQATTQLNEQTLSFVPKILVVLTGVVLLGPWMLSVMVSFAHELLANLHMYVR